MLKPSVKHFDGSNGADVFAWAIDRCGGRHQSPVWISASGALCMTNPYRLSMTVPRGAWLVSRRTPHRTEFTLTDWAGIGGLAAQLTDEVAA